MGSKKVIHLFCLQPYSRVPPSPSAPPVLSLTSQLAQRAGRWVPCFSPESGGPAEPEPESWVGPSWLGCFSWERFRAPHLGGSLHVFLGSQLLLLVACSLKWHPRTSSLCDCLLGDEGTLVCLSGTEALGRSLCVVWVGGQQWTAPLRRGSPHPPVGLGALLVLPRGRGVPQSRAWV